MLDVDAVSLSARHRAPVVDRTRRTGRDALHTRVALVGVDHIVFIVRNRPDRACRFTGIAPNAGLRVYQVLPDDGTYVGCHASLLPLISHVYFSRAAHEMP